MNRLVNNVKKNKLNVQMLQKNNEIVECYGIQEKKKNANVKVRQNVSLYWFHINFFFLFPFVTLYSRSVVKCEMAD